MKTARWMAACVVASLAFAAAGFGQSPSTRPAMPKGYLTAEGLYGTYEDLMKVCNLDEHQVHKISEIQIKREKVNRENQKTLDKVQDAMKKAYSSGDMEGHGKLMEDFNDAFKPVHEINTKAQQDTWDVLTKEQKAAWREYVLLKSVKVMFQDIQFTEGQWDKIMAVYEKLAKDPAVNPYELSSKLYTEISTNILTPEQKAKKMLALRYGLMSKVVNFTDEQIKQIVKIEDDRAKEMAGIQEKNSEKLAALQAAQAEAWKSGDKDAQAKVQKGFTEYYKIWTDANKKYDDKVQALLTDKQKAAWKAQQEKWKNMRPSPGAPGGTSAPASSGGGHPRPGQ